LSAYKGQIEQGTIGFATVADPRGNAKNRPVVIITDTSEIVLDAEIVAVAVTSTIPSPVTDQYVLLPWTRWGHPATGLTKRCAAHCQWLITLKPSDFSPRGYVPTRYLREILEKVNRTNS